MSTSSFSELTTDSASRRDTQTLPPQSSHRKFISHYLILVIGLVIFGLGCTNIASVNVLLPKVYPLPESTFVPEPTFIPTRVQAYAPTAAATPAPQIAALPTVTITSTPTITSELEVKYVVIISIDGLRPDALAIAYTPHVDSLIARGAYSPKAQTINNSVTLPSHASMLTSMLPEKHGIHWGLPYIGWPGMEGPTIFSVANDAGLITAMVAGKEKLNYLALPNTVDRLSCADVHDIEVKNQAIAYIQAEMPHILFIHFPDVDRVGHAFSWMSENQLHAISFVDGLIGEILTALEEENYLNNTLMIITADHGGHGFGHGDDSPEDRTIPWLAVGPNVRRGVTLSQPINTYDTAVTALYALNLPIPEKWDGDPVLEIFQQTEQ